LGANSPRYRLGLQVIPADQFSSPYRVRDHNLIPRIYTPQIVPGAKIGVVVDATNPSNVMLDLVRLGRVPTQDGDDPDARTRVVWCARSRHRHQQSAQPESTISGVMESVGSTRPWKERS